MPEKKKPGRPPLKRNDTDDVEWNMGSRRKVLDKFQSSNVWCGRERRRSSLRMSSFTTIDSDSEAEVLTATVKPTARVIPAVKKKDNFRLNRDSSCESVRNDSDFSALSEGVKSSGGGSIVKAEESPPKLDVEGIAVQDKKKSDTLRKLFSRREEGGAKAGGKGKGGKGKCGVIVMESEVERKLLERSTIASSAVGLSSPMAQNMDSRFAEVPIMSIADSCEEVDTPTDSARLVETLTEINTSILSPRSTAPAIPIDFIPKLTYNEAGKPSLVCKIDLSRIPYILAKKRSEEVRIKCELSDTRQTVDGIVSPVLDIVNVNVPFIEPLHSGVTVNQPPDDISRVRKQRLLKKQSIKKSKIAKRKRHVADEQQDCSNNVPIYAPTVHTPSVDTDIDDSMSTDSETKNASMSLCSDKKRTATSRSDSIHLMSS